MFEVEQLVGNTEYFEAYTNVGVYLQDEKHAILIDSCDHKRMVRSLDRILTEKGLSVKTIINTHCHVDHICGNKFFQDKYGCNILSTKLEQGFIFKPDMEPDFYNVALSVDKEHNPFYGIDGTESEIITENNIPQGFEIISLAGHSFEMIGVRTPDDVVFLADAVLSKNTWDNYKLPFFYNVNRSIDTLEMIKDLKARLFVPSHNSPLEDIRELAQYNIEKLKEKKRMIYELCPSHSFEEIFTLMAEDQELEIKSAKYCMYAVMVRNFLQSLIEDGKIYSEYENGKMVYHTKN